MDTLLRVLIVEDSDDDTLLLLHELRRGGYKPLHMRVDTRSSLEEALAGKTWDIILSDHKMPHFDSFGALQVLKENGADIPLIIVSGVIGEEQAVEAMRAGAADYIMKHNMRRLLPAIERELAEAKERDARRRAEAERQELRSMLEALYAASPQAIVILDADDRVLLWNPSAERIFGWKEQEVTGWVPAIIPDDGQGEFQAIKGMVAMGTPINGVEVKRRRKDGSLVDVGVSATPLRDAAGNINRLILVYVDLTESMESRAALDRATHHHPVTGLPNRERLLELMEKVVPGKTGNGTHAALMLIRMANIKKINESLGYAAGDKVLCGMARLLEECGRMEGNVLYAHLEGNDFAVFLMRGQSLPAAVSAYAEHLLSRLGKPLEIEGQEVFVRANIGIALSPEDGSDPAVLLSNASAAASLARKWGYNTMQFYAAGMNEVVLERIQMETGLNKALERGELLVHYQPRMCLITGEMVGMEALVRWLHPELGMVPPGKFIPVAEESWLIVPVGEWVLRTACRDNQAWIRAGMPPLQVAVNVSVHQLRQVDMAEVIGRVLDESGMDPQYLAIEITESAIMDDPEAHIATLKKIDSMGVKIAIDDFGTGYSSLSCLRRLPVDVIKIDRSFVAGITVDPDNATIVRTIVSMGRALNLKHVVEGIETEAELEFFRKLRCDAMQGYLFSRPLPHDEFTRLLQNGPKLVLSRDDGAWERTILVVDEEEEIATAVKRLMRRYGCHVLAAASASQAFDLLAKHEVGVVLCEHRMSEMSGSEFLERVKRLYPDVVRMLLTGYTEINAAIEAINRGAIYKFLTKPWESEALRENVIEALEHYEVRRENRRLSGHVLARTSASASAANRLPT